MIFTDLCKDLDAVARTLFENDVPPTANLCCESDPGDGGDGLLEISAIYYSKAANTVIFGRRCVVDTEATKKFNRQFQVGDFERIDC